jgi:hypothetical protein
VLGGHRGDEGAELGDVPLVLEVADPRGREHEGWAVTRDGDGDAATRDRQEPDLLGGRGHA